MPYPWPSFGDFYFQPTERALDGLGGFWNYNPSEARSRAQGAVTDSVVTISIGSAARQFDCYLAPSRLLLLRAQVGQIATFTDWGSPLPDSRLARLDAVDYQSSVAVTDVDCTDETERRALVTVRLTSQ